MNPLHSSQVLLHEPMAPDGSSGPWQAQTGFRATVRGKNGPYTERSGFDEGDAGAFVYQADGTALPINPWTVGDGGSLSPVLPFIIHHGLTPIYPEHNGRQYASLGELTWDHLQVHSRLDPAGGVAGVAVGVAGGTPVPQALVATVEPDGTGRALVVRSLSGGAEVELGRAHLHDDSGPLTLTVTAFDDTVRAAVGDIVVEAARGPIRNGRVALVARGPGVFYGIGVDGLDMYRFDFATSRYRSFQEHVDSFDGTLPSLTAGAAGGTGGSIPSLVSAHAGEMGAAMQATADPQTRQALFTAFTTALALPLRQTTDRLSLTRLTDASGTAALLLESPEPLAFSRDVTAQLIRHVRIVLPFPIVEPAGDARRMAALQHLRFDAAGVSAPSAAASLSPGDRVVRVDGAGGDPTFSIYDAPRPSVDRVRSFGQLRETVTPAPGIRPELDALRSLPAGSVAVLSRDGVLQAVAHDGVQVGPRIIIEDIPVPLAVLSNGDETAALLIPTAPDGSATSIGPGNYTLSFSLARQRWDATAAPDPESHYQQTQGIDLSW